MGKRKYVSVRIIPLLLSILLLCETAPLIGIGSGAQNPEYSGVSETYNFCVRSAQWTNPLGNNNINGITYQYTDGKWQWHGSSFTPVNKTAYNWGTTRTDFTMTANNRWVALELDVKESQVGGNFAIFSIGKTSSGGLCNVYLLPSDAAGSTSAVTTAIADNTYYIGELDCSKEGSGIVYESVKLEKTVNIPEEGKYILVFKRKNADIGTLTTVQYLMLDGTGDATDIHTVTAVPQSANLDIGDSTGITVTPYSKNGWVLNPESITYSSSSQAVAVVSETGTITGVSNGIATITVEATVDGVTKSVGFGVSVGRLPFSGAEQSYNFRAIDSSWDHPTQSDNRNIDGITYEYTDGTWQWCDSSFAPKSKTAYNYGSTRTDFTIETDGDWIALELDVPVAQVGCNHVAFDHFRDSVGAQNDIYIIPSSAVYGRASVIEATSGERYLIGELDCHTDGSQYTDTTVLPNTVSILHPGKYILVFKQKDAALGKTLLLKSVTLSGIDTNLSYAEITAAKNSIVEGETLSLDVTAYAGDDSVLEPDSIAYSSSDAAVAAVSQDGVVTGMSAGKAVITATVTLGENSVTADYEVTVTHNAAPNTASFMATVKIPAGGTANTGLVCSDIDGFTPGASYSPVTGTTLTVTAPETVEGKKFLYWQNANSKRVVSTENSYTFTLGSNTTIYAVYSEAPVEGQLLVEFIDKNGKVLHSAYVDSGTTVGEIKPADPFSVGYIFNGWSNSDTDVISIPTYIMAMYTPDPNEKAEISVINGKLDGGETTRVFAYNELVEVTPDTAPENTVFAYWKRDGKIVSYSENYSFYAWGDTTVEAVFAAEMPDAMPRVIMDAEVKGTDRNKAIFMAERTVPDGYTLVESGMLLADDSDELTLGNYQIKAAAQSTEPNGQFTVRQDSVSGVLYARAYLIYEDDGVFRVVYSDIVSN